MRKAEKKNSYVSAVPAGWNFFSAHPGAWEIHYSIFSFHTQIPLLFSALFTLTPAWLNSEVEISGKRNTQSPSISFWQHRIIGKTFFLCLCLCFYFKKPQKKAIPAARVRFFLATRNGGNIAIFFFGPIIPGLYKNLLDLGGPYGPPARKSLEMVGWR